MFLFVEKYFDMKKNQCKEGLDIYKKFLTRMTRISEFLKVAEVSVAGSQGILLPYMDRMNATNVNSAEK